MENFSTMFLLISEMVHIERTERERERQADKASEGDVTEKNQIELDLAEGERRVAKRGDSGNKSDFHSLMSLQNTLSFIVLFFKSLLSN